MDTEILTKICKLIPRLASDHEGEVVATARAIERTLKAGKEDWHSLVSILNGSEENQSENFPRSHLFGDAYRTGRASSMVTTR